MFDALLQQTTLPILEQVVNFNQARHTILAGNIANMDTPGYQARDLSVGDFQGRLKKAIQSRQQRVAALSPGDIAALAPDNLAEVARESQPILYHDGSNDGVEHQVTEMVKNQMQHNLALSIMGSQFRLLQTAISERV
ncbi:MAG: flagellar basal body rod protein FlgB [Thermoguttaceae bacterium]|nr:flagellar basal body rod protein FlgB [Thermoguttaceae bacterium]